MTTVPIAVRPTPLPSQAKPWAKAGVHLLVLYAIFGVFLIRYSTNLNKGLDEGRVTMADALLLQYIEGTETVNTATGQVTSVGPLNYDLRLALGDDWFTGSYTGADKHHICEVFRVDPAQVWQMIATNQGYEDTPENRATSDAFYAEQCAKSGAA